MGLNYESPENKEVKFTNKYGEAVKKLKEKGYQIIKKTTESLTFENPEGKLEVPTGLDQ